MALNMTTFDAALKQHYTDDTVLNLVYQDNPLFALIPKMEAFGGRNLPIPIIYANPQGRSATFATAQTKGAASNTSSSAFTLVRVSDYAVATIQNEVLEATKSDADAFIEASTTEIDGALNNLTRSLAVGMYRSGFGGIGTIGTIPGAVNVITLTNIDDVTNYEVNQDVVFSASDSGAVLRSATPLTVTNINRDTGTITFSANLSTVSAVVGDSIFLNGDRQNSATPTALKVSGLEAWLPGTAPTSTPFFGVDRSVDVSRLGGIRYNGVGYPIEEALIEGAAKVAREGGKLTHYFMNYANYSKFEKSLGSKVNYMDVSVPKVDIMFKGIQVNGPKGPIAVIPDQNCPVNRIFGLQMDTWKFYSLGKAVRIFDTDGMTMLRQSTADGVEIRALYYGQLGCRAPGYNINIQV